MRRGVVARHQQPRGAVSLVAGMALGVLAAALVLPEHTEPRLQSASRSGDATSPSAGVVGAGSSDGGTTGDALASGSGAPVTAGGGGAPADSSGGAPSAGDTVPAVSTGEPITVGVVCYDLSVLRAMGQNYDLGDCPSQYNAALDRARREGRVPVNGHDIRLVFREFNPFDASTERAACVGLIQDEGAFVLLASQLSDTVGSCAAQEFQRPILAPGGEIPSDETVAQSAPYLYTIGATPTRVVRNFPAFLREYNLLQGARVGIYYSTAHNSGFPGFEDLQEQMTSEGSWGQVVAVVATAQETAGSDDGLAVLRFRQERVDLALLLVNPIAQTSFMQIAEQQSYQPRYAAFYTQDVAAETYPPEHYDGTYGLTSMDYGTRETGALPPTAACMQAYAEHTHEPPPDEHGSEGIFVRRACDLVDVMVESLRLAGPNPSTAAYLAGMAQIHDRPATMVPSVTYGADRYSGSDDAKVVQFSAACRCFRTVRPFQALSVP